MTYAPPSTEARPRITVSSDVVHMCAHMLAHTREQQSSLSRTNSYYHGPHMTWLARAMRERQMTYTPPYTEARPRITL